MAMGYGVSRVLGVDFIFSIGMGALEAMELCRTKLMKA